MCHISWFTQELCLFQRKCSQLCRKSPQLCRKSPKLCHYTRSCVKKEFLYTIPPIYSRNHIGPENTPIWDIPNHDLRWAADFFARNTSLKVVLTQRRDLYQVWRMKHEDDSRLSYSCSRTITGNVALDGIWNSHWIWHRDRFFENCRCDSGDSTVSLNRLGWSHDEPVSSISGSESEAEVFQYRLVCPSLLEKAYANLVSLSITLSDPSPSSQAWAKQLGALRRLERFRVKFSVSNIYPVKRWVSYSPISRHVYLLY
jgi:hypothetical protein